VARKTRKKHRWLRSIFLFLVTPLLIWCVVFFIWLFWYEITGLVGPGKSPARPAGSSARPAERAKERNAPGTTLGREEIADEDRKKLDDILRRQ
jgi:hypothetical protein